MQLKFSNIPLIQIVIHPIYIRDWTGLKWNIILQKAENSWELRKLLVQSPVVFVCWLLIVPATC